MKQHPVVLVPCHRSHFDYVILSYIFHLNYMSPPHIAAGINLSFWPLGPLFRGAGAYFIRRSFDDNELYKAVFRSYLKFLIREGYTQEFFIEGGRSRTGKILTPKLGMLSAVVDAFTQGVRRDLYLVPVSIHYGRVVEEEAYQRELDGAEKEPESLRRPGARAARAEPPARHGLHHLRRSHLAQRRARRAQGGVPPPARPGAPWSASAASCRSSASACCARSTTPPSPARRRCRRPCCSACRTAPAGWTTSSPAPAPWCATCAPAACASPRRSSATTKASSARTSASSRTAASFSGSPARRARSSTCPTEKRLALDFYKNNTLHFFLLPALCARRARARAARRGAARRRVVVARSPALGVPAAGARRPRGRARAGARAT